jgi:heterodisulfide reductase subunit C
VECPKEIKITSIMYALKRLAIREKKYPKHFPIPVLAEEFFKMVRAKGRTTEGKLVTQMMLRVNPLKLLGMAKLGLGLMKTGRFSLKTESIRQPEQLQRLLDAAEAADKEVAR